MGFGISTNLLPERSRCLRAGYLLNEWFLNDPNDDNLLFLAYIDYKVYIVPNDNGNV
jgi:hypothetical protein